MGKYFDHCKGEMKWKQKLALQEKCDGRGSFGEPYFVIQGWQEGKG